MKFNNVEDVPDYIDTAKSADVTDQTKQDDDNNVITRTLACTYMCLYLLDLRKGTYVSYNNAMKEVKDVIPEKGWITVGFANFANCLVKPEFSQLIQDFTNLSTLNERMRYKDRLSCRFLGTHNIWCKVTFVACNRDEQGRLTKIIMAIRNIDDQMKEEMQQMDQMKRSMESDNNKTAFLQNMTHEIRTPLNAMYGFAQLLALPDGCLSGREKAEYLDHITNSFNMLTMLIDDVLDMADVSHGNYHTVTETVAVNSTCRSAMNMCEIRKQLDVEFLFTSDVDDSYTIQSDSHRIQQLLVNYITNACKHTQQGKVHLHVSTSETPGHLTFSVTDTGEGIPTDQANNIFERFRKLKPSVQGHGLGLNICSVIAEKLGGSVKLDTTYTNGARFLFII